VFISHAYSAGRVDRAAVVLAAALLLLLLLLLAVGQALSYSGIASALPLATLPSRGNAYPEQLRTVLLGIGAQIGWLGCRTHRLDARPAE
jgi:hypothetical protein